MNSIKQKIKSMSLKNITVLSLLSLLILSCNSFNDNKNMLGIEKLFKRKKQKANKILEFDIAKEQIIKTIKKPKKITLEDLLYLNITTTDDAKNNYDSFNPLKKIYIWKKGYKNYQLEYINDKENEKYISKINLKLDKYKEWYNFNKEIITPYCEEISKTKNFDKFQENIYQIYDKYNKESCEIDLSKKLNTLYPNLDINSKNNIIESKNQKEITKKNVCCIKKCKKHVFKDSKAYCFTHFSLKSDKKEKESLVRYLTEAFRHGDYNGSESNKNILVLYYLLFKNNAVSKYIYKYGDKNNILEKINDFKIQYKNEFSDLYKVFSKYSIIFDIQLESYFSSLDNSFLEYKYDYLHMDYSYLYDEISEEDLYLTLLELNNFIEKNKNKNYEAFCEAVDNIYSNFRDTYNIYGKSYSDYLNSFVRTKKDEQESLFSEHYIKSIDKFFKNKIDNDKIKIDENNFTELFNQAENEYFDDLQPSIKQTMDITNPYNSRMLLFFNKFVK